jgi:hypothetical protein
MLGDAMKHIPNDSNARNSGETNNTNNEGMAVISDADGIAIFRLLAIRGVLKIVSLGMKHRAAADAKKAAIAELKEAGVKVPARVKPAVLVDLLASLIEARKAMRAEKMNGLDPRVNEDADADEEGSVTAIVSHLEHYARKTDEGQADSVNDYLAGGSGGEDEENRAVDLLLRLAVRLLRHIAETRENNAGSNVKCGYPRTAAVDSVMLGVKHDIADDIEAKANQLLRVEGRCYDAVADFIENPEVQEDAEKYAGKGEDWCENDVREAAAGLEDILGKHIDLDLLTPDQRRALEKARLVLSLLGSPDVMGGLWSALNRAGDGDWDWCKDTGVRTFLHKHEWDIAKALAEWREKGVDALLAEYAGKYDRNEIETWGYQLDIFLAEEAGNDAFLKLFAGMRRLNAEGVEEEAEPYGFLPEGKGPKRLSTALAPVFYGFNVRPRQLRGYGIDDEVTRISAGGVSKVVAGTFCNEVAEKVLAEDAKAKAIDAKIDEMRSTMKESTSRLVRDSLRKEINREEAKWARVNDRLRKYREVHAKAVEVYLAGKDAGPAVGEDPEAYLANRDTMDEALYWGPFEMGEEAGERAFHPQYYWGGRVTRKDDAANAARFVVDCVEKDELDELTMRLGWSGLRIEPEVRQDILDLIKAASEKYGERLEGDEIEEALVRYAEGYSSGFVFEAYKSAKAYLGEDGNVSEDPEPYDVHAAIDRLEMVEDWGKVVLHQMDGVDERLAAVRSLARSLQRLAIAVREDIEAVACSEKKEADQSLDNPEHARLMYKLALGSFLESAIADCYATAVGKAVGEARDLKHKLIDLRDKDGISADEYDNWVEEAREVYHVTPCSSNVKTGRIPVTTSSSVTCPKACPFRSGGCYAKHGNLGMFWRKLDGGAVSTASSWEGFVEAVDKVLRTYQPGQLWRHNQAGDLPGKGDDIDQGKLLQLAGVNMRRGARGFTYTHKPVLSGRNAEANRAIVKLANGLGFTINLSANNLEQADKLAALGIGPVVVTVPRGLKGDTVTPAGRKVKLCPAQVEDGVTCATCQLCQHASRSEVIGFIAHGSGASKVERVAK